MLRRMAPHTARAPKPPKPPARPEVSLPALRPYAGGLEPDGDYDGLELDGLDLAEADGAGVTFLDCRLARCGLDGATLRRARLLDTVLEEVWGVGTQLAEAELRDVELRGARLGGTQLYGARLTRVHVRGGKADFLNLRQAVLKDVVFEDCLLLEPDFGDAVLERVAFVNCTLRRADLRGARLKDVDLRDAAELDVATGVDRLAGAVINSTQLMELAPAFAAQLGVRVL
jgi:uncharacterized protein YjbI with pentapeptide repeats